MAYSVTDGVTKVYSQNAVQLKPGSEKHSLNKKLEEFKLLFTHMFLLIFFVTSLCVKRIHTADTSFTFANRGTRQARLVTGVVSRFARVFRGKTTHLHCFLWNQTVIWSNWQRNKVLTLTILSPSIKINVNYWSISI